MKLLVSHPSMTLSAGQETMGEAKRRSELGLAPRQRASAPKDNSPRVVPWLPITRKQTQTFMTWTSRAAWAGIGAVLVAWIVVRFLGPALGWWTLKG